MSLFASKTSSAPPAATEQTAPQAKAQATPTVSPAPAQPTNPDDLTLEMVKEAVPSHMRSGVTQNLVDNLNAISKDPIAAEGIRNNFVSYSAILKEGKFKIEEYLNAVAYVSYKIMGYSNQDAYAKALPARYATLVARGATAKDISSYVSMFNKGKLVNMILEQSLVPSWVLNQDLFQKGINKLADLMANATSEKVQMESAIGLVAALGKPKEGSFQINIGESENAGMKEMREQMAELAQSQRDLIQSGAMKTIDVAAKRLVVDDE